MILGRETKVLIFDLYGTVVDMQAGLTEAATPYLKEKGWDGAPHRFVTWWRRTHFENSMIDSLCDRGHTSYREISHRALAYVMDRCGFPTRRRRSFKLVSQIETLKPFPEVPAALERLRAAGYALAILSNGDRDMLEAAMPHVGIPFDHVISVQEAGAFKPHWRTYAKAAEIIGVDRTASARWWPITLSIASAPRPTACGRSSSTAEADPFGVGETPHSPDLIVEDATALAAALA